MDILNIENCTIRYQEQEAAVEHVSLSVGEQEIVSIVGESGSGKTTLIRAILGILPPCLLYTSPSRNFTSWRDSDRGENLISGKKYFGIR